VVLNEIGHTVRTNQATELRTDAPAMGAGLISRRIACHQKCAGHPKPILSACQLWNGKKRVDVWSLSSHLLLQLSRVHGKR
jgi:hypothetical protein